MQPAQPIHILWDASHIWGLMAWRALRALGLSCRLVKGQEIAEGALLGKPGSRRDAGRAAPPPLLVVPGGNARLKALALGAPYFQAVGLCRAAMAAANSAKKVSEQIEAGNIPSHLRKFGDSRETLFADLPDLRHLYGKQADSFSSGAVGVFSYLNRIAMGLRHFAALNRKFDVNLLGPDDLIPLTREAGELVRER